MIANRESRMTARLAALSAGLAELGCEALVVLAPSAQDTDLAPFLPGPAELAAIREAAEGTCEAMRAVARMLAAASPGDDGVDGVLRLDGEPLTVARLRAEVGRIFTGRGFEQPRGNIIAPGEEGGIPHS